MDTHKTQSMPATTSRSKVVVKAVVAEAVVVEGSAVGSVVATGLQARLIPDFQGHAAVGALSFPYPGPSFPRRHAASVSAAWEAHSGWR